MSQDLLIEQANTALEGGRLFEVDGYAKQLIMQTERPNELTHRRRRLRRFRDPGIQWLLTEDNGVSFSDVIELMTGQERVLNLFRQNGKDGEVGEGLCLMKRGVPFHQIVSAVQKSNFVIRQFNELSANKYLKFMLDPKQETDIAPKLFEFCMRDKNHGYFFLRYKHYLITKTEMSLGLCAMAVKGTILDDLLDPRVTGEDLGRRALEYFKSNPRLELPHPLKYNLQLSPTSEEYDAVMRNIAILEEHLDCSHHFIRSIIYCMGGEKPFSKLNFEHFIIDFPFTGDELESSGLNKILFIFSEGMFDLCQEECTTIDELCDLSDEDIFQLRIHWYYTDDRGNKKSLVPQLLRQGVSFNNLVWVSPGVRNALLENHKLIPPGSQAIFTILEAVKQQKKVPGKEEGRWIQDAGKNIVEARGHIIKKWMLAAREANLEALATYLANDPTLLNAVCGDRGETALIAAADRDQKNVVQFLLEKNADTTIKAYNTGFPLGDSWRSKPKRVTALEIAQRRGHKDIAAMLVKAKDEKMSVVENVPPPKELTKKERERLRQKQKHARKDLKQYLASGENDPEILARYFKRFQGLDIEGDYHSIIAATESVGAAAGMSASSLFSAAGAAADAGPGPAEGCGSEPPLGAPVFMRF